LGRVEKSIKIYVPPEKVWEMLAFDKHLEWMDIRAWSTHPRCILPKISIK
jgi:uncharacterized protein YndB with AHSA1/START domain